MLGWLWLLLVAATLVCLFLAYVWLVRADATVTDEQQRVECLVCGGALLGAGIVFGILAIIVGCLAYPRRRRAWVT